MTNIYIIFLIGFIVLLLAGLVSFCMGKTKKGLVLVVIALVVLASVCKRFNIMI